jgi:hypothetical protein
VIQQYDIEGAGGELVEALDAVAGGFDLEPGGHKASPQDLAVVLDVIDHEHAGLRRLIAQNAVRVIRWCAHGDHHDLNAFQFG